jgi:predicted nucleic acid-binding protein
MILADTSIWIDHLRKGNSAVSEFLREVQILMHPFIIGELACGNLKNRKEVLQLLMELPEAVVGQHDEVMQLVNSHKLMGQGIGWIDAHLLTSSLLSGAPLWTADRKLRSIAAALGVLY